MYAVQLVSSFDSVTVLLSEKQLITQFFNDIATSEPGVLLTLNEVVPSDVFPDRFTLKLKEYKIVNYLETKDVFTSSHSYPWRVTTGNKVIKMSENFPKDINIHNLY